MIMYATAHSVIESFIHVDIVSLFVIYVWHPRFPSNGILKKVLDYYYYHLAVLAIILLFSVCVGGGGWGVGCVCVWGGGGAGCLRACLRA